MDVPLGTGRPVRVGKDAARVGTVLALGKIGATETSPLEDRP